MIRLLLLLSLCAVGPALAEGAGGSARATLTPSPELLERLVAFRAALADGRWEESEAAALGEALLGPQESTLRPAGHWRLWPPQIAPVGALIAPWAPGRPVLEDVAVVYRPPDTEATPREGGRHALLLAPYTPGLPEALDTPDPVLEALRPRLRRLDLVPRNDAGAPALRAALADQSYALLLLRASPAWVVGELGAIDSLPPLVGWWRPDPAAGPATDEATLWEATRRLLPAGGAVTVELWPRDGQGVAAGWDRLVEELQRGASLATAHAQARRALARIGKGPGLAAAGWILVGNGELHPELPRRSWWQQFWGGRRSKDQKSGQ